MKRRSSSVWLLASLIPVMLSGTVWAAPFAYVADSWHDRVHVIDLATDSVFGTPINVGTAPVDVAVNPDGSKVYVANRGSHDISVIETADNSVTTIPIVGENTQGVAISPNGAYVYTAHNPVDYIFTTELSVIDAATNQVIGRETLVDAASNTAFDVVVSPDGSKIYVSNRERSSVSVVDANPSTGSVTFVDSISVGNDPHGLAVSPDGARLYVANTDDNSVSVINTTTMTFVTNIAVGDAPWQVAVHPSGAVLYVTNMGSTVGNDTLSVIDTATNTVVDTIAVGGEPHGVDVNTNGSRVYVSNHYDDSVSVIDTATSSVTTISVTDIVSGLQSIAVEKEPHGLISVVETLAFNDTPIDQPVSLQVTLSNGGDADLFVDLVDVWSSLQPPFSIKDDYCSAKTLVPGGSCQFWVGFAPTAAGPFSSSLAISSDFLEASVNMTGFGLSATGNKPPSPPVLVSPAAGETGLPTSLDFTWEKCTDPDGDAVSYSVQWSTDSTFPDNNVKVAAYSDSSNIVLAGSGMVSLLLFGGALRSRQRSALLLGTLLLATTLMVACGGGGGGDPVAPSDPHAVPTNNISATVSGLSGNTTYYWKVIADDGKDGGRMASAVRTFTTQ